LKLHINTKTGHLLLIVLVAVFSFPQSHSSHKGSRAVVTSQQFNQTNLPTEPVVLGAFSDVRDELSSISSQTVSAKPLPDMDAKALLVYQPDSGQILVSKNADLELPIASITKLMTALVVIESAGFLEPITITERDQLDVAPNLKLKVGDEVMPIDLVKAMLVGSANDAALTLANHFPNRVEFVAKMNMKAVEYGMFNTNFSNPMGFDSDYNYSSAADLNILVEKAMTYLPYDQIWQSNNYSFKSQAGNTYRIQNSNDLVFTHRNIKSIKTGLTPKSMESMIALARNSQNEEIITIVLDTSDRNKETLQLVDYVFKNFNLK
jgi:serine-type D-Ala-D-Ala carboxypeptidase (penicillin-binding protein 5/6)